MKIKPVRFLRKLLSPAIQATVWPADFEDFHKEIIEKVRPYTMTSNERLFALIEAVKYIVNNHIEGDIVECGVWKGGSMMAAAETLRKLGQTNRNLYLYDTYAGMTAPTDADKAHNNETAAALLEKDINNKSDSVVWAYSSVEEVRANVATIGYPAQLIHFIEGDVLKTIPATVSEKIALLRLDTDWYESTKHEMIHLYPKLVSKGALIIDDYGFWKGSRQAVDEYIAENKVQILLNRIDDTGRVAVKN